MRYRQIKRILDFAIAFGSLTIFSPLFLAIMIWIKLDSKGPIFFSQKRVGKNKKYFIILKFRTMFIDKPRDQPTHLLETPEKWITPSGRFLRKTSLDELPQLINILKGDMSLIGPRPALWNQKDLLTERDKYGANEIPVGLTGWAQINGRDELSIEEKARLDGDYTRRFGLFMDIRCFLKTLEVVLSSKGVIEGRHSSGSPKE